MAKISMDGIIAYALLKNKKSDTDVVPIKQITNAKFDENNLLITFDDNSTIKAPFSSTLKHTNKGILDKISINEQGKLMYDNNLVCDLSEAIKKIILNEEENALVIQYFNQVEEKILLQPIIEKVFKELQGQGGGQGGGQTQPESTVGGMFFYKIVSSYDEMENIIRPKVGSTVIITRDKNNNNERSLYTYTGHTWQFIGSVEPNRDFTKNPINLQSEITGVLPDNAISSHIARIDQLHSHNNLSTLDKLSESSTGILLFNGNKIVNNIFYDKHTKYDDINILKFSNFLGRKNADILELRLDIASVDLKDMPKNFSTNKVLVSNSHTSSYDLKNIDELVDVKENFSIEIQQMDWESTGLNGRVAPFKYTINHNLNSTNLIVAFYNNNVYSSAYTFTIIDENNITVKANTDTPTKVVINCSQGTVKGDGSGGGTIIGSDHTHNNLPLLQKFTTDDIGNLFFDGTRIFTNFNPLSYKKVWQQNSNNDLSLLLDYSTIFREKDMRIITRSDLLIKNANSKVNDESINKKNVVKLQVIEDDTNIVLDVDIKPNETQKYEVGINPNTKVYVKGFFSGSLVINYFDTSFVQTNDQLPDVDIGGTGLSKSDVLNILKTHKFIDELDTGSKTVIDAINEIRNQANSKVSTSQLNNRLVDYQVKEDRNLITENKEIVGAINELKNLADSSVDTEQLDLYQLRTDNSLQTTSKEIVGSINELKERIDSGGGSGGISQEQLQNYQLKIDDRLQTTNKELVIAINELKTEIDVLKSQKNRLFKNLVYGTEELTNGYFNQNGSINSGNASFRRRFIPVLVGEKYQMKGTHLGSMTGFFAYFDEEKRPIEHLAGGGEWTNVMTDEVSGLQYRETRNVVPEGVSYIGMSYNYQAGHGRALMVWSSSVGVKPALNDYVENFCYY